MVYSPRERTERTLEDTEQYQQLAATLPRIFTDQHLSAPYPHVVIVDPSSDRLRTPDQGILNRFTSVVATRHGFKDRVIYVSEIALKESPQLVIWRVEHAVTHLHVHSHYREGASWHGNVFDRF